jgi:hypothetical protein
MLLVEIGGDLGGAATDLPSGWLQEKTPGEDRGRGFPQPPQNAACSSKASPHSSQNILILLSILAS